MGNAWWRLEKEKAHMMMEKVSKALEIGEWRGSEGVKE